MVRALEELDPKVRAGLEESIARARAFAARAGPGSSEVRYATGATVTQRWVPVRRVGLYVPGGLAVYPSSVIMNAVPALAAGVGSLAIASPPQKEFGGLPHPTILAAAQLLGVQEVHAMGGAQAIAALAYGVAGCRGRGRGTGHRAGRRCHRTRKPVCRNRQAPGQGRCRDRRRGGTHRNRDPGRCHGQPRLHRRGHDLAGRARPERRGRAGHRFPGTGASRARGTGNPVQHHQALRAGAGCTGRKRSRR